MYRNRYENLLAGKERKINGVLTNSADMSGNTLTTTHSEFEVKFACAQ